MTATVSGATVRSATLEVPVVEPFTAQEIDDFIQVNQQATSVYAQRFQVDGDRAQSIQSTLTYLSNQSAVESAQVIAGGNIHILYKSGMFAIISTSNPGTRAGGGLLSAPADREGLWHPHPQPRKRKLPAPGLRRSVPGGRIGPDSLGGLVANPFRFQFGAAETDYVLSQLNDVTEGIAAVPANNAFADLDLFRNLNRYGVIHLTTHGILDVGAGHQPGGCISTGVQVTPAVVTELSPDYRLMNVFALCVPHIPQGQNIYVGLTPAFFSFYFSQDPLPGSLVNLACCSAAGNPYTWRNLASIGAQAMVGFDAEVPSSFADTTMGEFVRRLCTEAATVQQAYSPESTLNGNFDAITGPEVVHFVRFGEPNLSIFEGPKVKLTADTDTLESDQVAHLEAEVEGFNLDRPHSLLYLDWSNTGLFGQLQDLIGVVDGLTQDYLASYRANNQGDAGTDTIRVRGLVVTPGVGGGNTPFKTKLLGTATQSLTVRQNPTAWGNPGPPAAALGGVAFGQNKFVAVGLDNSSSGVTIVSSDQGSSWQPQALPEVSTVYNVRYLNGQFLALYLTGAPLHTELITSEDGLNWTHRGPTGGVVASDIAFLNGTYVVAGDGGSFISHTANLASSTDLQTWVDRGPQLPLNSVKALGGRFVAVGPTFGGGKILTSPNGIDWTQQTSGTSAGLSEAAYNGSRFVVVGDNVIRYSDDGVSWQPATISTTNNLFERVEFGGGRFRAVGRHYGSPNQASVIYSSPDGLIWTEDAHPTLNLFSDVDTFHLAYGSGAFLAVTNRGQVLVNH